jgi:murein DD-endopeptidase MepM/ murein hydrolase activator NlpD
MITFTAHISRGAARLLAVAALAICAVATSLSLPTTAPASTSSAKTSTYGWPVKPFHRQHPIRGAFGDPRTMFWTPPTTQSVLTGDGSFSFHFGVDISAPDGTNVYPVVSGRVSEVHVDWLAVDSGDGRSFQYWHIRPAVGVGDRVDAYHTVLGQILKLAEHVHFTEIDNGTIVNPVRAGHLTPYVDRTKPEVDAITFRATDTGRDLMPSFLRGSIEMIAESYDTAPMPVPGKWKDMPVAPALLTWHLQTLGGRHVTGERVAADFRRTIPKNSLFWSYYARGTYQNQSVFKPHYSWEQPGCYLFKLTRGLFDTHSVKDGVYDLVVTASDIQGNHSSSTRRMTIHNRPGWIGG